MASIRSIPADEIRLPGSRTLRYEGAIHGSSVSFFLVTSQPGQGPDLHRHPLTWTVLEGEATLLIGDATLTAHAGETTVAPANANTWHRFHNSGTGTLRIVCIHASPKIIQEFATQL